MRPSGDQLGSSLAPLEVDRVRVGSVGLHRKYLPRAADARLKGDAIAARRPGGVLVVLAGAVGLEGQALGFRRRWRSWSRCSGFLRDR